MVFMVDETRVMRESQAKNLIIKAWRERWTDIQWGINVKQLVDKIDDCTFLADCILQQALNGPGPNSLVLSYLMHSIYSQILDTAAVFQSVSKYDGYHKPFCITSLLDILNNIKDRIILRDPENVDKCMDLASSLENIVHWLLKCMYSSLESLSDLTMGESPSDTEESRIVVKCRKLIEFFLTDSFLRALLHVAILENHQLHGDIKKMSKEVAKFTDSHHLEDINQITDLINNLNDFRMEGMASATKALPIVNSVDEKQMQTCNPAVQAIIMAAALLRSCNDIPLAATDLLVIKQLKNLSAADLFCEAIHSSMIGLVDAVGKEKELKFIGFTFLQLPSLLSVLKEKMSVSCDDLKKGITLFLNNESTLDIIDARLNCYTLDLLLTSFQKNGLIDETSKKHFLKMKPSASVSAKQNSSNAVFILKAESTLLSVLKTLDGDCVKNQDAILGVLCDMLGKSFELILTAASCTGRLQQVISRLIKLNQCSRQVTGENSKASSTRAMIFDITFLMLCQTVQNYGAASLTTDEPDCFFDEWVRDCMVEDNTSKNPDTILEKCDQNKVELLLTQYIQSEPDLKTSLVFWHEICTNAVGVVRELLLAWENEATTVTDVKKILDVFRTKVCCLPVCISAWLCSYIQVMPEERCGKARYILNHFLTPSNSEEPQDHFKERYSMMSQIITKMTNCIQREIVGVSSPSNVWQCISDSKPASELYKRCWNCLSARGLLDVETVTNLDHLMEMSGPDNFVQNFVVELLNINYSLELAQWCDLTFGIFHLDLRKCTASLVRIVLPSILLYSGRESAFVEPQLDGLVSLVVNCIVAYYLHSKSLELDDTSDSSYEPSSKKRKISRSAVASSESLNDLADMLKDLFQEFENVLAQRTESRPECTFILKFLEQMAKKTPIITLLNSLPSRIISKLMSLMCEEMTTPLLFGLYNLMDKLGRRNCVQAICSLRFLQNLHNHHQCH